jgi:hypothetical protein
MPEEVWFVAEEVGEEQNIVPVLAGFAMLEHLGQAQGLAPTVRVGSLIFLLPGLLALQIVVAFLNLLELGMIGRERCLEDGNGALIQRLRFGVFSLLLIQPSQIVQGGRHRGMVFAERFFFNLQRTLVQRLRFSIFALRPVKTSEII